jgi:uncharacterized membrane protein
MFIFYGLLGLLIETIFTGLHSWIFDRNPRGVCTTYLPMFFLWGSGGILFQWIHQYLTGWVFVVFIVPLIFLFEFTFGKIFIKLFGKKLWDYGNARFGVAGLIRIDYLPFWLILAISFDYVVDFMYNGMHKIIP